MKGYIPKDERKKIMFMCDDVRFNSGIGGIGREIMLGTAHHYNWVQIAGSIQHPELGKRLDMSADINKHVGIEDSYVVLYPVNGYGDPNIVRAVMEIEKPDAILLFTDPRYWIWFFQMEHEVRTKGIKLCYLNIWDDFPPPLYNYPYYASCDLLMNISKQTHGLVKQVLDWGEHEYEEINLKEEEEVWYLGCNGEEGLDNFGD